MSCFGGDKKLVLGQGICVYRVHNWKETIRNHFSVERPKVFLVSLWPKSSHQQLFLYQYLQRFAASAFLALCEDLTTLSSCVYFFNKMAEACIMGETSNVSATWFHVAIQHFLTFTYNGEQMSHRCVFTDV